MNIKNIIYFIKILIIYEIIKIYFLIVTKYSL